MMGRKMNRIELAHDLAKEAHKGQRRSDGSDYFCHPIRVAEICSVYKLHSKHFDDLICTAYLHDTVEDTDITLDQIGMNFGPLVASLVNELTSDKFKAKELGKTLYLSQKMVGMSNYGLTLKLCDRLDNVRDLNTAKSVKWRAKYVKETTDILGYVEINRILTKTQTRLIGDIRAKLAQVKVE
jgi:guanosine-3',5'-bis(diphosphate) 3'-pyrophosphohydrolase